MRKLDPWMVAVVVLATVVRLWGVVDKNLTNDEATTLNFVVRPMHGIPLAVSTEDRHAPLYFLIEAVAYRLGDMGTLSLRAVSLLLGVLVVPLAACLARWATDDHPPTVRAAALLVALSPYLVGQSQEARPHMLAVFLSGAALCCYVRLLSGPWRPGLAVGFTALSVCALYTQYLTCAVTLAESLVVIAWRKESATGPRRWAMMFAAIAACWLPWVGLALHQASGWSPHYHDNLSLTTFAHEVAACVRIPLWGASPVRSLLLLTPLLLAGRWPPRMRQLAAVFVIATSAIILLTERYSVTADRYLAGAALIPPVVVTTLLARLPHRRMGAASLLAIALFAGRSLWNQATTTSVYADTRPAAVYLRAAAARGDCVVCRPTWLVLELNYYLPLQRAGLRFWGYPGLWDVHGAPPSPVPPVSPRAFADDARRRTIWELSYPPETSFEPVNPLDGIEEGHVEVQSLEVGNLRLRRLDPTKVP